MKITWFYTGQNAWKNSCKPEWKQKNLQKIQPLTLYIPFFTKKVPLSYTFYQWQMLPLPHTLFRTLYPFGRSTAVNQYTVFFYIEINLKNSLYTDVLFFFSFLPFVLVVSKSPAVYILSPALDGLWKGNRGSLPGYLKTERFLDFLNPYHSSISPIGPFNRPKWQISLPFNILKPLKLLPFLIHVSKA